jgi:hypothetical protein
VRWKFPLKTGRHTGPNALLGSEVSEILTRFSPQKDGLVRYVDFLRYCDPPANVREGLRKIRAFLTRAEQSQGAFAWPCLGVVVLCGRVCGGGAGSLYSQSWLMIGWGGRVWWCGWQGWAWRRCWTT